jgi:hypothetical protein
MWLPGGSSSDIQHGFPGSILCQRDLWWTKWHRDKFLTVFFQYFPIITILPILHTHAAFIYRRRHLISAVHQYSETNVMRFLFNLLRIKGLYMFRALLAHPQEVQAALGTSILHACYVCGLHQNWSSTSMLQQPTDTPRTQHTTCRLCNAS